MGTASESFVKLTERIGRKTGGLAISPLVSAVRGRADPLAKLIVSVKATADKAGDAMQVVRDVLLTARLGDRVRFEQMIAETAADMEADVIGSGHSYAARRLSAQTSVAGWVREQMGGYSYLKFVRELSMRVEDDWDAVVADMEEIRAALLSRNGAIVNLTGDAKTLSAAQPHVEELLASLPPSGAGDAARWASTLPRVNEALTVPTQVNYVGQGGNLYADGYQLHGSAYVIEKHLANTWLWDKVRVVGGAYGGFCSFDPHSGSFLQLSYRDPNLLETVDIYNGTADFLRKLDLTREEVTKAVIGTMGEMDAYMLPDAKGYAALNRYLLGLTDDERQRRRDEILATSPSDFRAFADAVAAASGDVGGRVVAVTSAEKARAVLERSPGYWDVHKVL